MTTTPEVFKLTTELSENLKLQAKALYERDTLRKNHRSDPRDLTAAAVEYRRLEALTTQLTERIVGLHVMELERAERENA